MAHRFDGCYGYSLIYCFAFESLVMLKGVNLAQWHTRAHSKLSGGDGDFELWVRN
jgi:hypothetical protein